MRRLRIIRRFKIRALDLAVVQMAPIASVDSHPNGRLPDSVLDSFSLPQGGTGRLSKPTMRKWRAMVFIALVYGNWTLTGTSSADFFRTLGQQENAYYRRTTTFPLPGRRKYGYKGVVRWLKLGMAGIATPGESNHGKARAVDHGILSKLRRVSRPIEWLRFAVPWFYRCGWSWEASTEDWHVRDVTGDEIPPVVLAVERCIAAVPLRRGSTGEEVRRMQDVIGAFVDGDFGPKSEAKLREWQASQRTWYGGSGLPVDGVFGADDRWVAYEAKTAEADPGVAGLAAAYMAKVAA